MTCYHVIGSLHIKADNARDAETIKDATSVIAADTGASGKTLTNNRNFNISTIATATAAKDSTQHIKISLRFKEEAERDKTVDQLLGDVKDKINEDYYSFLETHICHHDEGADNPGIEKSIRTEWGQPFKPL